jgi:hypothetical protein
VHPDDLPIRTVRGAFEISGELLARAREKPQAKGGRDPNSTGFTSMPALLRSKGHR